MKRAVVSFRTNAKLARQLWGEAPVSHFGRFENLLLGIRLSVAGGDLQLLDGRWYVTHSGLLQLASGRGCRGINTSLQDKFSDFALGRWVFKAVVFKSRLPRGSSAMATQILRTFLLRCEALSCAIAETRAVNRALRKAYGIGLCSVEELGAFSSTPRSATTPSPSNGAHSSNGSGNGQPRLRDQLCLLIRQHNLDPNLVKAYAADFCGTEALSGASRELVESFISHLASAAKENRDALVCKLNSYAQPVEAQS